jgi:hypothetical protein
VVNVNSEELCEKIADFAEHAKAVSVVVERGANVTPAEIEQFRRDVDSLEREFLVVLRDLFNWVYRVRAAR